MPPDLPVPTKRRGDGVGGEHGEPVRQPLAYPVRSAVLDRQHDGDDRTDNAPRGRCLRVLDVSLACCAVEYLAAATEPRPSASGSRAGSLLEALGVDPFPAGPGAADVLVVSGTVTEAMAPVVRAAYEAMEAPRYVLSFGACSNTGGPYWDSYSVVAGVDRVVPVDVYVPGCPPSPEALADALARLHERVLGGAAR